MIAKKFRKYSWKRFYFINILFFLVITVLCTVLFTVLFCKLGRVRISGNVIYSKDEIEAMVLDDKYKNNAAYDMVKSIIRPKKDIPFIEEVKVRMLNLHDLKITVKERELYGYLRDEQENYVYFDLDGIVTDISDRLVEGVLPVTGLSVSEAVVGEPLPVNGSRRKAISVLLKNQRNRNIAIDEIQFDEDGSISLICGKNTAMLGTKTRLEEKMRRLSYILPQLQKRTGILHLEDWSEDNTDIVFEKTASNKKASKKAAEEAETEEAAGETAEEPAEETAEETGEETAGETTTEEASAEEGTGETTEEAEGTAGENTEGTASETTAEETAEGTVGEATEEAEETAEETTGEVEDTAEEATEETVGETEGTVEEEAGETTEEAAAEG